jgi:hypothetical protein
MPFINPDFKEHVASLCGTLAGDATPQPLGTCFFVCTTNSTGREFHYLVTARHVYDSLCKAGGPAYLRINKGKAGEYEKGVIDVPIPLKAGWLFHRNQAVDLAVLPREIVRDSAEMADLVEAEPVLALPSKQETYRYLWLNLDSLLRASSMGFPWPPIEGERVMFIAMTLQFQGVRSNLPTVRHGHLALVPKEHLRGYQQRRSRYYVIESQVYRGNSGAPVWVEMLDKDTRKAYWFMMGVLVFSYPEIEELDRMDGVDNAYYNLGLTLVTPIEEVIEIVNSREEQQRRESIKGPHAPGVALSAKPHAANEPFSREDMENALKKVPKRKTKTSRSAKAARQT